MAEIPAGDQKSLTKIQESIVALKSAVSTNVEKEFLEIITKFNEFMTSFNLQKVLDALHIATASYSRVETSLEAVVKPADPRNAVFFQIKEALKTYNTVLERLKNDVIGT
jgi:uncharacterized protein with von Willebrand factor type A (vWA) domain